MSNVLREPTGRPRVQLHGEAAAIAQRLGVSEWHISLSHLEGHALASVIGVGSKAT